MPAILNLAANVVLGAALVLAVRRSPALREGLLSWSFFALLAFQAVVFTPIATYLFRFYPQWSMLYLFDPQIFPELDRFTGALSALVVLLNFAAALGSYAVVRHGVLTGRHWLSVAPLVLAATTLAYVVAAYWDRIAFVGDYDEFWQGHAVLLPLRPPGWAGGVLYVACAVFLVLTGRRFGHRDPSLL